MWPFRPLFSILIRAKKLKRKNYSEKETFISAFSYKGRANYDLWWSVNTKHVNRAKYRPNGMIVQVVCEQST
jgi:hypothetical protein